MFGLFLILPVLALYAGEIDGATPAMVGVALGIYGLTQALFQVPFGLLSDRFGRKPLLVAGLLLFALGSVIAARANSIEVVILGRALQGSGAIASVVLALLADLTREEQRTKAVAVVGASIGFSFLLALMLGPILDAVIGLSGIFLEYRVTGLDGFAGGGVVCACGGATASWWRCSAGLGSSTHGSSKQAIAGYGLRDPRPAHGADGVFCCGSICLAGDTRSAAGSTLAGICPCVGCCGVGDGADADPQHGSRTYLPGVARGGCNIIDCFTGAADQ